jgi:phosphatidylserine/phosphatidylglycerophosphate/cardiolipin synthase-like enzyme
MKKLNKHKINKIACFVIGGLWTILCILFVIKSLRVDLPKNESEYCFFFKETGYDLKYLSFCLLKKAQRDIFVQSFGFSDPDLTNLLEGKSKTTNIILSLDKKDKTSLINNPKIQIVAHNKAGLMHRKILGVDEEILFMGSTNLTPMGLMIHSNHFVAIRSKKLFQAVKNNEIYQDNEFHYFPIPHSKKIPIEAVKEKIRWATNRISVAMYAFSHIELSDLLIDAKNRGVKVEVFMDRSMNRSVSKGVKAKLKKANVDIYTNITSPLLHHKCALIDNSFIFGSSNWTESGFKKNEEYIVIIEKLKKEKKQEIETFFKRLKNSSLLISK